MFMIVGLFRLSTLKRDLFLTKFKGRAFVYRNLLLSLSICVTARKKSHDQEG